MSVRGAAAGEGARHGDDARSRILAAAYALFAANGVRAIGIDRIVRESRVAKMTLYRHFRTKEELVLAFLNERTRRWTYDWLESAVERLASDPRDRALAVFDALDEWFRGAEFEGCSFSRTLYEIGTDPIRQATVDHLELARELIARHAGEGRRAGSGVGCLPAPDPGHGRGCLSPTWRCGRRRPRAADRGVSARRVPVGPRAQRRIDRPVRLVAGMPDRPPSRTGGRWMRGAKCRKDRPFARLKITRR